MAPAEVFASRTRENIFAAPAMPPLATFWSDYVAKRARGALNVGRSAGNPEFMSRALRKGVQCLCRGALLPAPDSMKFAAVLAALVFASAHAVAQEEAWNAGRIFVPASLSQTGEACVSKIGGKCMDRIAEGRHPVILFMHGCDPTPRPRAFLDLGAIVVQPNSFWQGERCTLNAAEMAKLLAGRANDLADAARQLQAAPWADPARLVLAGYSQGGIAAALYEGSEFRARIVIAWPCQLRPTGPSGPETGVRGKGPVLAIQSRNDALYTRLNIEGDCGPDISGRPGSRSVLIPGNIREIMNHPAAREAIAAFVPEVMR